MIKKCRDCKYWFDIPPWQGNCRLHPTPKPQWSESAAPCVRGCHDYVPKHEPVTYIRVLASEDKAG